MADDFGFIPEEQDFGFVPDPGVPSGTPYKTAQATQFGLVADGHGGFMDDPQDRIDAAKGISGYDPRKGAYGHDIKNPNLLGVALTPFEMRQNGLDPRNPQALVEVSANGQTMQVPIVDKLGVRGKVDLTGGLYKALGGQDNPRGSIEGLQYRILPGMPAAGTPPVIASQPAPPTDFGFIPDAEATATASQPASAPPPVAVNTPDNIPQDRQEISATPPLAIQNGGTLLGKAGVNRAQDAQQLGELSDEHYAPSFPAAGVDFNAPRQKDAFEKYLQPVGETLETANSMLGRRQGSIAGGLGGAALGAAMFTNPWLSIPAMVGLGYAGGRTGGAIQEKGNQYFETPEETQARHDFAAYEESSNPGLGKIIDYGSALPFFRPSPTQLLNTARGLGYMRAGTALPAAERAALINTAAAGGIGAGQHAAVSAMEGRVPTMDELAKSAAGMALLNKPTGLGRYLGFPSHDPNEVQPSIRPRPQFGDEPITDASQTAYTASEGDVFKGVKTREPTPGAPGQPAGDVPNVPIFSTDDLNFTNAFVHSSEVTGVKKTTNDAGREVYAIRYTRDGQNYFGYSDNPAWEFHENFGKGFGDASQNAQPTPTAPGLPASEIAGQSEPTKQNAEGRIESGPDAPAPPTGRPEINPERDYTPAVRTKDGSVFTGQSHPLAIRAAMAAGHNLDPYKSSGSLFTQSGGVRGYLTKDGAFVTNLLDVAREEMRARGDYGPGKGVEAPIEGPAPPPDVPPVAAPPVETAVPPQEPPVTAIPAPSPEIITSIKNAQTDIDRMAMALQPPGEPNRRPFEQVEREARENYAQTDSLISELESSPRVVSDTESAQLALKWNEQHSELDRLNQAVIDGDPNAQGLRRQQLEKMQSLADVLQKVGTKAGQSLAARKMFDVSDWTLDKMIRNSRAARGGRELTTEELEDVNRVHDSIKKGEELLEKRNQVVDEERSGKTFVSAASEDISEATQAPKPKATKPALKRVSDALDRQEAEAEARIAKRRREGGSLGTGGLQNLPNAADYVIIGAARIARGAITKAQFGIEMIKKLGEEIRPFLGELYNESRKKVLGMVRDSQTPEDIRAKMAARIEDGANFDDLGNYARALGKAIIQQHLDRDGKPPDLPTLRKELTAQLGSLKAGITEREASDLYSGYGETTKPSQKPVDVAARELRAQAQKQSQIDDLQRGIQALKSGPQHDKVSDEIRRKEQQVKELLRDAPKATDPETQLRSALDAQETRLKNELKDLTRRYDLGDPVTPKQELPADERNAELKAMVDRVRKALKDVRQLKERTDDKKADASIKFMDKEIERLTREMQQDIFRNQKNPERVKRADELAKSKELQALREERKSLAELQDEISGATQAKRIEALEKQRDELDRQMQTGDIAPKSTLAKEEAQPIEDLKAEIAAMRAQRDKMRRESTAKTPAQRKADRLRELDERITALDKDLQAGTTAPKPKTPKVEDVDIEAKKAELAAMQKLRGEIERAKNAPTLQEIEAKQIADLEKQIAELEARLASGNFASKPTYGKATSVKVSELTRERNRLNDEIARARRAQELAAKGTPDQRRLAAWKAARLRQEAELHRRIAAKDYTPKMRANPPEFDAEAQAIQRRVNKLKDDFRGQQLKAEAAQQHPEINALEHTANVLREGTLSGPGVIIKLTTIATELATALKPLEEVLGAFDSKLLPGVARRAPREGSTGFRDTARTEWHAIKETLRNLTRDVSGSGAGKFGKMDIDLQYGKPESHPDYWYQIFSKSHGALKTPARRNEFSRSMMKRLNYEERQGSNPNDPEVMQRVGEAAYEDARRVILMNDNLFTSAYTSALNYLRRQIKPGSEGESRLKGLGAKLIETAFRVEVPIVRIPTNFVIRTLSQAFGSVAGVGELGFHFVRGMEAMSPEAADRVLRNLKQGKIGLSLLLYGLLSHKKAGGYHEEREKRAPGEPAAGEVNLAGMQVPKTLLHVPYAEIMQMGATIARAVEEKSAKLGFNSATAEGIKRAMMGLLDETPLTPPNLTPAHHQKTELKDMTGRVLQSHIPQLLQWGARYMDRDGTRGNPVLDFTSPRAVKRNPKTVSDYLKMGIPGMRKQVPSK